MNKRNFYIVVYLYHLAVQDKIKIQNQMKSIIDAVDDKLKTVKDYLDPKHGRSDTLYWSFAGTTAKMDSKRPKEEVVIKVKEDVEEDGVDKIDC